MVYGTASAPTSSGVLPTSPAVETTGAGVLPSSGGIDPAPTSGAVDGDGGEPSPPAVEWDPETEPPRIHDGQDDKTTIINDLPKENVKPSSGSSGGGNKPASGSNSGSAPGTDSGSSSQGTSGGQTDSSGGSGQTDGGANTGEEPEEQPSDEVTEGNEGSEGDTGIDIVEEETPLTSGGIVDPGEGKTAHTTDVPWWPIFIAVLALAVAAVVVARILVRRARSAKADPTDGKKQQGGPGA
ncbi:MAG: hypothetical protein LBD12_07745 [Clostridiales Family XIII bacterium]|nr:hypothetical protein [Clostridiales Family XIII bacterium]